MTANQISNYLISLSLHKIEDDITNLKLQKVLYYIQGFHLAIYDSPLFEEEIEAWKYGPVVVSSYRTFKDYGNNPIVLPDEDRDFSFLSASQKKFITKVYTYYRQFSAIKLMEMTHEEKPWSKAYGKQTHISKESLRAYFKHSDIKDLFVQKGIDEERKRAAELLLVDYLYDDTLTEFSALDNLGFHED